MSTDDGQRPAEHSEDFYRLVFIMSEIDNAIKDGGKWDPVASKFFLGGYFEMDEPREDLEECFQNLPAMTEEDLELPDHGYGTERELTIVQLRSFLHLLNEFRNRLVDGRIQKNETSHLLRYYLSIIGPRLDLLSRVLYYFYPPHGRTFEPEEVPDDSTPPEARKKYPTECLAISLVFGPKAKLNKDEYNRYNSLWKEVYQGIEDEAYGPKESLDTLVKISVMFILYKDLIGLLMKIPWLHNTESGI